jgi:hypothetical protein
MLAYKIEKSRGFALIVRIILSQMWL